MSRGWGTVVANEDRDCAWELWVRSAHITRWTHTDLQHRVLETTVQEDTVI